MLVEKEIFEYEKIDFEWLTKDLGHAEFVLCPVYNRKKVISKLYIYPKQQKDQKYFFVIKNKNSDNSGLNLGCLLINNELQHTNVWTTYYCKEHKTMALQLYVPKFSKQLHVSFNLGGMFLNWN